LLLLTRIEYFFFFFFSFFFFFYLLSASVPNLKVQLEEAGRQPISRWIFPQAQVSVVRIFPDYTYNPAATSAPFHWKPFTTQL
jgi:hypothetical protein